METASPDSGEYLDAGVAVTFARKYALEAARWHSLVVVGAAVMHQKVFRRAMGSYHSTLGAE